MGPLRLWFWLNVMDLIAALGYFGSDLYLWAVSKASNCIKWGTA